MFSNAQGLLEDCSEETYKYYITNSRDPGILALIISSGLIQKSDILVASYHLKASHELHWLFCAVAGNQAAVQVAEQLEQSHIEQIVSEEQGMRNFAIQSLASARQACSQ